MSSEVFSAAALQCSPWLTVCGQDVPVAPAATMFTFSQHHCARGRVVSDAYDNP